MTTSEPMETREERIEREFRKWLAENAEVI
jgi:hypothetical protein